MNKMVLAAVGVAILLILLVAGFFMMNRSSSNTENNPEGTGAEILGETPNSLRDLLSLSSSQSCTFSDENGNSGTVYAGGGKMRGDFVSTTEDTNMRTHMFSDGATMYMWFDGQDTGFKVAFADASKFTDFGEDGQKSVDMDQEVNFNCSPWPVDNTKFDLPKIEFQDFGAMFQETVPAGSGVDVGAADEPTSTAQCETCNSLPAEAQAQCRELLGC